MTDESIPDSSPSAIPKVVGERNASEPNRRKFVESFLGGLIGASASVGLVGCGRSDSMSATKYDLDPSEPPAASPATPAPSAPPAATPSPTPTPAAQPPVSISPAPPPGTPLQLGSGAEVGTVVGSQWTPGRDSAGRVNQVSWESVPKGRWIEVAGTRIDEQLTSVIVSAGLGWTNSEQLWGTTGGNSIFQSWSGFAVDQAKGRLWFLGGGHSDGYNNGLYRFDLTRMQWGVECAPSDRARMTSAYLRNGSSTFHPDSNSAAALVFNASNPVGAKTGVLPPAVDGPFYDEIPFDGKPTARHTYQGLIYVPEIGSAGSIFMHARRLWRYDIASGRWAWKRLVNDVVKVSRPIGGSAPTATEVMEIHAAEAAHVVWDERSSRILCEASGSGGAGAFAYNWTSHSWSPWKSSYALNYNDVAAVRVGRQVVSFKNPYKDQPVYPGRYWVHDLDADSTMAANVQYGGGLSQSDFRAQYYDGTGMVYVPSINRFWICTRMPEGMSWLQLDPTTTPWTLSRLTFPEGTPVKEILVNGRLFWIDGLNAVAVWDHCFKGLQVYRF